MNNVKVSELSGRALEWATQYCYSMDASNGKVIQSQDMANIMTRALDRGAVTDIHSLGPLIKEEKIGVWWANEEWHANFDRSDPRYIQSDPHCPMTAVLRCFIQSRVGQVMYIPDEFMVDCDNE